VTIKFLAAYRIRFSLPIEQFNGDELSFKQAETVRYRCS